MEWMLLIVGVALAAGAVVLFWPIHVHVSLQGRGDPSGAWALAGGAEIGPLAVSGAGARGAPGMLHVHVLGRKLWQRPLLGTAPRKSGPPAALARSYERLARFFDPLELALFVLDERRRVQVPELEVELAYSFEDVMLTGQLTGAIFALDSVMPARFSIRQRVSWVAEDRASLRASGTLLFRIGPLAWDVIGFVARNVKIRRPRVAEARS